MTILSKSPAETMLLGEKLGRLLPKQACLLLFGDLGSGKTTFTKGIGKGLEIRRMINSPTFTIVKEYQGKHKLYHVDLYRTEGYDNDYFIDEIVSSSAIVVLEWPLLMPEVWPKEYIKVSFSNQSDEDERLITIEAVGLKYQDIVGELDA